MSAFSFRDRGKKFRIARDADEAEASAIRAGRSNVYAGIRDDLIAGVVLDETQPSVPDPARQVEAAALDDRTGQIVEEIERRISILGGMYPFSFNGSTLDYRPSSKLLYEFLLLCSVTRNISTGRAVFIPRNFERVTMEISSILAGKDVDYLHVGWPRRLSGFKATWQVVHNRSGEWAWRPISHLATSEPSGGDEGVDFIFWTRFGCGRDLGQLFFLGQCACGADWDEKFSDIDDNFFRWFSPPLVNPVKVFAVPHCLSSESILDASNVAGVVMDRFRLLIAADRNPAYRKKAWARIFNKLISDLLI